MVSTSLLGFFLPNWQPLIVGLLIMLVGVLVLLYLPSRGAKRWGVLLLVTGLVAMFALSWLQTIFTSFRLTVVFIAVIVLLVAGLIIFKGKGVNR